MDNIGKFDSDITGCLCIVHGQHNMSTVYSKYNVVVVNNDVTALDSKVLADLLYAKEHFDNLVQSLNEETITAISDFVDKMCARYDTYMSIVDVSYRHRTELARRITHKKRCRILSFYLAVINLYCENNNVDYIRNVHDRYTFTNIVSSCTLYNPYVTVISSSTDIPINYAARAIHFIFDEIHAEQFVKKTFMSPTKRAELLRSIAAVLKNKRIIVYKGGVFYWDNR